MGIHMKAKILKMLRSTDGFVSGQSICEALDISRTAVWKYINQLKNDGYEFDAVSNKGYRIAGYPDIVTKEELESQLESSEAVEQNVVKKVIYHEKTDSTNNLAKQAAEDGEESGTLFVAESQTGGRGRRGRTWVSPVGSGIWMTLLLRPQIKPSAASMLTIVSAMAVASAINDMVEKKCYIKWPNDIVMGNHKICGILTEMSAETDWTNYVVIGIGINVNITQFDEEIKQSASSILLETGQRIKRSAVIVKFIKHFSKLYAEFMKTYDLSALVEAYNAMLINCGRQVRIEENTSSYTAVAQGIDDKGRLIVVKEDGSQTKIVAGEVSVRGLYGYV